MERETAEPVLSVVIPNWNGRHLLHLPLESLREQTTGGFEVILADNGSSDGSLERARELFPAVRILAGTYNRGVGAALNAGIRAARAPLVAVLNNDAAVSRDWVEAFLRGARLHPEFHEFACRVMLYHAPDRLDSAGQFVRTDGGAGNRGCHRRAEEGFLEPVELAASAGVAAVYRAEMLRALGAFDEGYFAYYEDTDLSLRARLAGYRCLYLPDAVAYHLGSATAAPGALRDGALEVPVSDFTLYHTVRNRLLFVLKNFPAPLLLRSLPVILATQAWLGLRLVREGRGALFRRGLLDALRQAPLWLRKRRRVMRARRISSRTLEAMLVPVTLSSLLRRRWRSWRRGRCGGGSGRLRL